MKGPTRAFMEWAGEPASADGVAALYGDLLDGIVSDDERLEARIPTLRTDTLMGDAAARARLARETLDFALALA